MEMLNNLFIYAVILAGRVRDELEDFRDSEKGISNVVATIIILLIVVLLIGVFWDRLKEWVSAIMDTIFGTEFDSSGLGG